MDTARVVMDLRNTSFLRSQFFVNECFQNSIIFVQVHAVCLEYVIEIGSTTSDERSFLRPFCFEYDFSQIFSIFLLRQFVNSIQFF